MFLCWIVDKVQNVLSYNADLLSTFPVEFLFNDSIDTRAAYRPTSLINIIFITIATSMLQRNMRNHLSMGKTLDTSSKSVFCDCFQEDFNHNPSLDKAAFNIGTQLQTL